MDIQPLGKIICRTPAFGTNQTLEQLWNELKPKIAESSPGFYQLISHLKYTDIAKAEPRIQQTIWKYFNRSRYRQTPFGSLAAVSLIDLAYTKESVVLAQTMTKYHFVNWNQKQNHPKTPVKGVKQLLSNSSFYIATREIRYIKISEGTFELAAIAHSPLLAAILFTCRARSSPKQLIELTKLRFDMDEQSTASLIEQLIGLQLLHTDSQPNIIGEDYFNRLGFPCPQKPENYIISHRRISSGSFDGRPLKHLADWIGFMASQFPIPGQAELSAFREEFTRRFAQQEVNLAQLMDPQIGIGYGHHEQQMPGSLVNELKALSPIANQMHLPYGSLQQFLLKGIISKERIDLATFPASDHSKASLPNTLSAVFHLYQSQPVIENLGGATANSLLGRFTHCHLCFEDHAKDIAAIEMQSNPEVLFFDIGYQGEQKVDNINRRKQLYPYELPILSWSLSGGTLELSDILVAVQEGKVVLKSKKLGKRLMPRIPSAYNYNRSDLSVYRFLCDIQSQGLSVNLNFSLQEQLPGLDHYPRAYFRNIIVSPAQWLLPGAALISMEALQGWLEQNQLNEPLKIGHSDQSLCIDPTSKTDRLALYSYAIQQKESIYLTEALLSRQDQLPDEQGNRYFPQYIAAYFHRQRLYQPSPVIAQQPSKVHLPGSSWLYLEFYCHPSTANRLLSNTITGVLWEHKAQFKKWFFVRYTDPSAHLRVRLHLKNPAAGAIMLEAFEQGIAVDINSGTVFDFSVQTYRPETQRYGHLGMELTEKFFSLDSSYVLKLIRRSASIAQLLAIAVDDMRNLCRLALGDLPASLYFVQKMLDRFAAEFKLDPAGFKKLNAEFNKTSRSQSSAKAVPLVKPPVQWERVFVKLISRCKDQQSKQQALADLIHMHINRIFSSDQRMHELICYHHLHRILQISLAVRKK